MYTHAQRVCRNAASFIIILGGQVQRAKTTLSAFSMGYYNIQQE
jgi:hypothetical protein